MPHLLCSDQSQVGAIAVALAITEWGRHTGVIARAGTRIDLIHLAAHERLLYEPFDATKYSWVNPQVTETDGRIIASLARKVAVAYRQGGLPYALKKSAAIAADGTVIFGSSGSGFTCATFVLALFEGVNIRLISDADWQVLEEDVTWQLDVISLMRASGVVDENHLLAQESSVGSYRFRPEDVAAAAMIADSSPNNFATIRPLAEALIGELQSRLC
jgi:hypothetical protein